MNEYGDNLLWDAKRSIDSFIADRYEEIQTWSQGNELTIESSEEEIESELQQVREELWQVQDELEDVQNIATINFFRGVDPTLGIDVDRAEKLPGIIDKLKERIVYMEGLLEAKQ